MERQQAGARSGHIPLAVVVVDGAGLVSHWSSGAQRLFACPREEAVGLPALDLLPISGALTDPLDPVDTVASGGPGDEPDSPLADDVPYPTAGWARVPLGAGESRDVLWWAYPMFGPGSERLLVLAADAGQLRHLAGEPASGARESVAPGFALHTEFPGAQELARRLPEILPDMGPRASSRVVSQVLDHGYPVLEISRYHRVPVTPDWGISRRAVHEAGGGAAVHRLPVVPGPVEVAHLEHAAVRGSLELLHEISGSIGATLELERTVQELTDAVVPRFADFAGTHLREQILAGSGFPDGPPDARTLMHRVWVTHTDEPGRWDDTVPVGESFAFPVRTPFFQCMTTGQPVLIPRISDELGNKIASQFERRDLRPLINGRSLLIVPLRARRVVLGFMVLLRRADRQPFDEMDRTTAA